MVTKFIKKVKIKGALFLQKAQSDGFFHVLFKILIPKLSIEIFAFYFRLFTGSSENDPLHKVFPEFLDFLKNSSNPNVLEIGAKNSKQKGLLPANVNYTGFDIHDGTHVNLTGDAHQLSSYFENEKFDAVFLVSVLEHIMMPWKLMLEINKVLKPGGKVFIFTHPAYPQHALPWDFWRISPSGMEALLNKNTGFEIEKNVQGLPSIMVPIGHEDATKYLHRHVCYLGIAVIARKISSYDKNLVWNASLESITDTIYPKNYGN